MAVTAVYDLLLRVTESITPLANSSTPSPQIEITDLRGTINATTTVPATKQINTQITLSAGAATMDLISNTYGFNSAAVSFSGLKVQLAMFFAAVANTSPIVIADGASNGLNIFGDASGQITLSNGTGALFFFNDKLDDVASGDKTIDLSSSDADAIINVVLVAG